MILDLEWWHLCFVAVMVFLTLLFTNYVIKKINEARIEERYARLAERTSTNQGTQIQELGLQSVPTVNPPPPPPPPENGTKIKISLIFDKDDNIQQDYRTPTASMPNKVRSEVLADIKEVDKTEDTASIKPYKQASIITNITGGSIVIKDSSDLAPRLPISEKVPHNTEETLSQNIESLVSKLTHTSERNMNQNNNISVDNNKDQAIKPSNLKLQVPNTSEIIEKTHSHTVASLLTKEMLLQEKNSITSKKVMIDKKISTILNSEFVISEISHAPVVTLSQKTSNSSLIMRNSNVKATNTRENTSEDDSINDDGSPSTTIGVVMLQVCQKADNSLFHNTNELIDGKQNVIKRTGDNSAKTEVGKEMRETPLQPPQSSICSLEDNNLDPKAPKTKESILGRDVMVTITSTVSEPQTSKKKKKKTENKLSHKSSNTSRDGYHQKLKNFWDIFL